VMLLISLMGIYRLKFLILISFPKNDENGNMINMTELLYEIKNMSGRFRCKLLTSNGVLQLLFLLFLMSLIAVMFGSVIGWCDWSC
jgi:hypothetical protein